MNSNTNQGRNLAAAAALMLSAGHVTDASAFYSYVTPILSNNGAKASTSADTSLGTLGKLDPKFVQLLVAEANSGYPTTGNCNVCHGSGSTAGGDASAAKSAAKNGNYAYFAAPVATNTAPKVTATTPAAVTQPAAVTFKLTVTDAEGDTVTVSAGGSINGVPASTYYNDSTRTFSWSPTVAGTYAVTFTPNDGKLNGASTTVNFTVNAPVATNTAPKVSATAPAAVTEPAAVSFKLTVTDAEGDTVTVTPSGDINGVPASSYYNDATRTFSWSPTVAGSYAVKFTPNDGKVNGATATVNITVDPASTGGNANNAPLLTKPVNGASYTTTVGTAVSIPVEATDQDGDDVTLSYTGTDGSAGDVPVTYDASSNAWTGSFSYTPASANLTSVKFTFTAKDVKTDPAQEKTSSATVTVKVNQPSTGGTGISAIDATRANWTARRSTLNVAGTVTAPTGVKVAGKIVTITNTATGATIGTAKVVASRRTPNKGTWSLTQRVSSSAVPCSVTASIEALSDSIAVSNAPESACSDDDDDDDDDESDDDAKAAATATTTTSGSSTTTTTPGRGKGKGKGK